MIPDSQLSLLDPPVEPTHGRSRASDPATSVTGARRAPAATQRRTIAAALLRRPYVTADWLAENDHLHQSHRSAWSSRCGDLVRDGYLAKSDPVPGPNQLVLSYVLTPAGREWARQVTAEGRAA